MSDVTSVPRSPVASRSGAGAGAGSIVSGIGLVLLVVGTFLPWLQSGSVVRNSYRTVGIARRLTALGEGVPGALSAAWPAVGIAATVCAALYVIGARRSSAVAVVLLAVVVGTVATLAMVLLPGSESTIRVIAVGPVVTLGGAVLAVVGALTLLAGRGNNATSRRSSDEPE